MSKKEKTAKKIWDKKHNHIFETFALEMEEFSDTGAIPPHADQDLQYSFELLKKRLEQHKLEVSYRFEPGDLSEEGYSGQKNWKDHRFVTKRECRDCSLERTFRREGKQVYRRETPYFFYQYITKTRKRELVAEEPYVCPNCGAVSTIRELSEGGCPYCGTFFEMSDLFPKVSGFFFVKTFTNKAKDMKAGIRNFILLCMLLCVLPGFFIVSNRYPDWTTFAVALYSIFFGAIIGLFLGFMLFAFFAMGKVLLEAARSIPLIFNSAGSKKQFENRMKEYTREFSYEYFTNKAISMLKTILYAQDMEQLPYYLGDPLEGQFDNIVESLDAGAAGLAGFKMEDGHCNATLKIYMENIVDDGGRLHARREKFKVYLYKNLNVPMNLYYSIRKIGCKSCGASFDATRQRSCPRCGSRYEIGDDDWVILKVEKM